MSAVMGYFGSARISGGNGGDVVLRASNIGLAVKQNISMPQLIDGRFDATTYKLEGIEVGGSIAFPLMHGAVGGYDVAAKMWDLALARDPQGGTLTPFTADIYYTGPAGNAGGTGSAINFAYSGLQVNTFGVKVQQGGQVTVDMDLMGTCRSPGAGQASCNNVRNNRVITWNDVDVSFSTGGCAKTFSGCDIRSFSVNVNNNVERFYTLNRSLFAQYVTGKKRMIQGSLSILGRSVDLSAAAASNSQRCQADGTVTFKVYQCSDSTSCLDSLDCGTCGTGSTTNQTVGFGFGIPGLIYQIEQMSLTPGVFESTVAWKAIPGAGPGCVFNSGDVNGADKNTFRITS